MLSLRRELILKRVNESFGGSLARITNAWPGDDPSDTPHRSTLLRWMTGETQPRSAKQILGLAGALDVDPFCLWTFDPANFDVLCARIVAIARKAKWARFHPALAFSGDFVGPLEKWPPEAIATRYYQRPWCIRDFEHPARRRNYYGAIAIEGVARLGFADPQVLHFAYRDAGIRRALWRPYGFVEVASDEVRLFNYAGLTHVTPLGGRRRFFVETWFGEGTAVFRVASLHDLKLTIASEAGTPRVRFSLPSPLE